jgi:hypothetical protein
MRNRLVVAVVVLLTVGMVWFPAPGKANCTSDSTSDCMDKALDAAKEVFTDPANGLEHAREAGKAAGNCVQCASEEMSNTLRNLTPTNSYRSGGSSSSGGGAVR